MKKIKISSRNQAEKLEEIADIFFQQVLKMTVSLWTDRTLLTDFSPPNDIAKSVGKGSKEGTYKFQAEFCYEEKGQTINRVSEWEEAGVDFYQQIIEQTQKVFRVDISEVVDEPLVKILEHIVENFKPVN